MDNTINNHKWNLLMAEAKVNLTRLRSLYIETQDIYKEAYYSGAITILEHIIDRMDLFDNQEVAGNEE